MNTLQFTTSTGIDVAYKTDIIGNQRGKFTVSQVVGLDTVDEQMLFQFKQLPYDFVEFKKFAIDNNLKFTVVRLDSTEVINTEKYTATFDVAGGTPEVDSVILEVGSLITAPEDITKEGLTLTGWSDDGENLWDFEADVITSDVTLTAIWE